MSEANRRMGEFGVGHSGKEVSFDENKIPKKDREGILEDYRDASFEIGRFLVELRAAIASLERADAAKVFEDLFAGVESALNKTSNQILCHAEKNSKESSDAFDELSMILKVASQEMNHPDVLSKSIYKDEHVYELSPVCDGLVHRELESVNALFSNNNIAWNIVSRSPYSARSATKSGIRLDYGPLYDEKDGVIIKSKTRWMTSVDVSGFHIDKVMNAYSLRGHHFPHEFAYKFSVLLPGLSKAIRTRYDAALKHKSDES